MTCFQGSFRRALFFLENSRKRAETTFRSTVRYAITAPTRASQAAEFGVNSQFVLAGAHATCSRASAEASPAKPVHRWHDAHDIPLSVARAA